MNTSTHERNRQQLISYMQQGCKTGPCLSIGLELEHFVVRNRDNQVLTLDDDYGVAQILTHLAPYFSSEMSAVNGITSCGKPIMIDGHLMGYEGEVEIVGALCAADSACASAYPKRIGMALSLEPASQFEVSIGPFEQIVDFYEAYMCFLDMIDQVSNEFERQANAGFKLLRAGYNPLVDAREMPISQKRRYQLMNAHFTQTGSKGIDMMRATASTQVSIDYTNEADFVHKYRLAVALAPIWSLICDNTPIYRNHRLGSQERMMHAKIWQDVDPVRCGMPPTTFDPSFGFASYVDWVLSVPTILMMDEDGNTYDTKQLTGDEIIAEHHQPLAKREIEHIFSMVFPDVRAKNFIEIRDADSLPPSYAAGYGALIKGLFYHQSSFTAISSLIGLSHLNITDVQEARSALMRSGFDAQIYGHNAGELIDQMFALARNGLGNGQCTAFLDTFYQTLCAERKTAREVCWPLTRAPQLTQRYRKHLIDHAFDQHGYERAQNYLDNSYAIRKGKTIDWLMTPKLYTDHDERRFAYIANKTARIMQKATHAYLHDPAFRAHFSADQRLNDLIDIDPGYDDLIPVGRVDIFYNEDTGDFRFCELNTDGSSGMIFMRELTCAFDHMQALTDLKQDYSVRAYNLFDTLVTSYLDLYRSSTHAHKRSRELNISPCEILPRVAIVDYEESIMRGDCNLFLQTFEKHGMQAQFVDIRHLIYQDGVLTNAHGDIFDLVWRRAVTSEILEKPNAGADALISATKDQAVCTVGSFRTQPAGAKELLPVLCSKVGKTILTPEEHAFIKAHTPQTFILDERVDVDSIIARPAGWIIKPQDSYGGKNVIAGKDYLLNHQEWEREVYARLHEGGYIIQEYVTPYQTLELTAEQMANNHQLDQSSFESFDNLVGLYIYRGAYAGIYSRAGQASTITSHTKQYNVATFIVDTKELERMTPCI